MKDMARLAYEAYAEAMVPARSGRGMPAWEQLSPELRQAWDAAAQAILSEVNGSGE